MVALLVLFTIISLLTVDYFVQSHEIQKIHQAEAPKISLLDLTSLVGATACDGGEPIEKKEEKK